MPRDLASRITPYLSYMPKLTRAQQAAAGNLGAFPRAAQIGRDDPRFAQYAGASNTPGAQGGADSRLAPAGQPLGPKKQAAPAPTQRQRAADRKRERQAAKRTVGPAEERRQALGISTGSPPVVVARSESTPTPAPAQSPARASPPPSAQAPASLPAPVIELPPQPVVVAQLPPSTAAPGFELAPSSGAAAAPPVVVLTDPPPASPAQETISLAAAFADLSDPHRASAPAAGAVDITSIKPKREVVEPPQASKPKPPPPPKPKAPSRVWVQVATGKDLKALAFDWRRFGKKAPELLAKRDAYTAKWGVSRRLVTGPFDSERAASKFVSDLKKAGIDSFTFTSEAGEEVTPLK